MMIKIAESSIQCMEQISSASIFAFEQTRALLFRNQRSTRGLLGRIDSRSPKFVIDLGLIVEVDILFVVSFSLRFLNVLAAGMMAVVVAE